MRHILTVFPLLTCLACLPARASDVEMDRLLDMSLQDLVNLEITTAAKKPQKLSETAAAVFVIPQEDLRRSGATSIPDALRLAPGLQVARIDSNKWAVSARGFNGRFANKLLVLMDGRSVYSPTFSGVYWEVQDYPLQDIERIEVIRGPGASLWGANAVNGVINIITKTAQQTQGGSVTLGAGSFERVFGTARYGAKLGENTYGRAYAQGFRRDGLDRNGEDGWDMQRGGFRVDREGDGSKAMLQGNLYRDDINQIWSQPSFQPPYETLQRDPSRASGFNLLGRWTHALSLDSEWSLQTFYDHTYRNQAIVNEQRDTFDLEFQHRFHWLERHDLLWGLGYRHTRDRYSKSGLAHFGQSSVGRQFSTPSCKTKSPWWKTVCA